jgi:hypothetical protein
MHTPFHIKTPLHPTIQPATKLIAASSDSEQDKGIVAKQPPVTPADQCNDVRFEEANEHGNDVMSKYLPRDPCVILPEPLVGPYYFFSLPNSFLASLQDVFNSDIPTPSKPLVRFDVHQPDLQFNLELLQDYDYDFEKFLSD